MKKIALIIVTALILFTLLFIRISQQAAERKEEIDSEMFEEYLDGMQSGREDTFLYLYKSTPNKPTYKEGALFRQDKFTLQLNKTEDDTITCSLYLNNYTVKQALAQLDFYIGIYGCNKNDKSNWEEICPNTEDFIYYSLNSYPHRDSSKSITSEFYIPDDVDLISIIIIMDGKIYAVEYNL